MAIVFAILMFSVLIFVHEFGHFITAKLCGVQVNEFSVFMGPAIFKKQIGETLYSLRLIPIGGYCAMEGEDTESDNPRAFGRAAWWKRLIILVAGAAMNFIIGIVLIFIVLLPAEEIYVPEITTVETGSALGENNGIQAGDVILEIDGEPLYLQQDFSLIMTIKGEGAYDVVVRRDGQKLVLQDVNMTMRTFLDEEGNESLRYGITIGGTEKATFGKKLAYTWYVALDYVRSVRFSLQMLFTGRAGLQDLGGPVMIVQQMAQTAEASADPFSAFFDMLSFGALIAVNLAVMNLLPIPALDGGRVVGLLITTAAEKIFKRKIDPKYEGYLHGAGMLLLLAFMALVTFKDIFSLFKG